MEAGPGEGEELLSEGVSELLVSYGEAGGRAVILIE